MTQVCELLGVAAEVAAIRYPSLRRSRLAGIRPAGRLVEGSASWASPLVDAERLIGRHSTDG